MQRLPATLALLGLTLAPLPATAQWGVSVEVGVARFAGTSRDSAGATGGPYRPTTFGLRLDRTLGQARVAVAGFFPKTGLAREGQGVRSLASQIGSDCGINGKAQRTSGPDIPGPPCVRSTRPTYPEWLGWENGPHHCDR